MQDYLANETARIKETPSTYADGKPIEFNLPSDFRSNKGNVGSRSGSVRILLKILAILVLELNKCQ